MTGVLIKGQKVLLVQRDEEECPEAHLKWEIPGGKIELGETPTEALVREFAEETGIKVQVKSLLPIIHTTYWEYAWGSQQTIVMCYTVEYLEKVSSKKDHHVKKVKWFELDKIHRLKTVGETISLIELAVSSE